MREIVLDIETTGLEFTRGDRIIEIGCVELINYLPTGNIYQKYLNPEKNIPESEEKVNGLTNDFLKQKPSFKKIVPSFLEFIKKDPLVVHNAEFDLGFINNELKINNLSQINNTIIDTLIMARKKFPGSPANLDALCRRFDIDLEVRKKHGALIDARLTAKVYLELKGGQQPNFNLNLTKDADNKEEKKRTSLKKKKWEERVYSLSDEESERHKKFIKKIKSPIWNLYN